MVVVAFGAAYVYDNYVILFVPCSSFSGSMLTVAHQPHHMLFISITSHERSTVTAPQCRPAPKTASVVAVVVA